MTGSEPEVVDVRELVGVFADRMHFEDAIEALVAAGFAHGDLSILTSHDPIEAAEPPGKSIRDLVLPFLTELRYEVPLVTAGLIALAAGPTAAVIAAVVAAGVGGAAVREILSEVTAMPHTADFERALDAGSLIVWVAIEDEAAEARAREVLERFGAGNIHIHTHRAKAVSGPA
ncbi:MAG: hypothetical protein H7840_09075 [Alphaproteobacteria bacterium]